jgi:hypothetical protein
MRVTPVSAYMAASNDGKLETLRAKNRPFQGSRMRGAAVQASRFDRCAQSLQTFFRSPPARQKLLRFRAKSHRRLAANLTMDSLFSTDQIEGRWRRLTGLL